MKNTKYSLPTLLGWLDAKTFELGWKRFEHTIDYLKSTSEYQNHFDQDNQPKHRNASNAYERGYNLALATHVDQRVSK